MKNKLLWLGIILLASVSVSCSDDLEEQIDYAPEINIPAAFRTINLEQGETSRTITFTASHAWTVSVTDTREGGTKWIEPSAGNGSAGEASLILSVDLNYTGEQRFAYLDIAVDNETIESITVIQEPVTLEVPEEVRFEDEQIEKTVAFEAGQPWTAVITGDNGTAEWLSISPESGEAGISTITLTATPNYSRTERTAGLEIKIGELSENAIVTQNAWIAEIADDEASVMTPSGGFYVVNEDWFGHDNGTVNYFKKDGAGYDITYRAYRAVNTAEANWFGATTQFATVWGDNIYFCSKEVNHLVIADAKTLQKKAIIDYLGGAGRSFVGVDDKKGYAGHAYGIVVVDIENMLLGSQIPDTREEIGSMCLAGNRVFAVSRTRLYVINTSTDEVEQTITGNYYTLTRSKDGDVWVATSSGFVKYDPVTLETEEIAYPEGAPVAGTWFAWNAGSLCSGTQDNVLYWTSSGKVVKYDIDSETANTALYTLGTSTHGSQLAFYGAGLRADPLTGELILTVKHSGWGSAGAYNWIYKLDANGNEIANFELLGDNGTAVSYHPGGGYFWFPAMPFFEDANKPQILLNQILVKAGEETVIDLGKKVVDYDNASSSIRKAIQLPEGAPVTAELNGNLLTVKAGSEPGTSTCTVSVISNGVRVDKTLRIDVER